MSENETKAYRVMNEKLKQLLKYDGFDKADFNVWFFKQFLMDEISYASLAEFSMLFLNNIRVCVSEHFHVAYKSKSSEQDKADDLLLQAPVLPPNLTTNPFDFSQGNELWQVQASNEIELVRKLEDRMQGKSLEQTRSTTPPLHLLSSPPPSSSTSSCQRRRPTTSVSLESYLNASPSRSSNATPNARQQRPETQSHQKKERKQKKRLMPTQISGKRNDSENQTFGSQSSFSNEENIRKLSLMEVDCEDGCIIRVARKSPSPLTPDEIRHYVQKISERVKQSLKERAKPPNSQHSAVPKHFRLPTPADGSFERELVRKLASVYSALIDGNLVVNILHEIEFLMNLLDCIETKALAKCRKIDKNRNDGGGDGDGESPNRDGGASCDAANNTVLKCLKDPRNATYFAIMTLSKQQHTLSILDVKTLGVLCSSSLFNSMPNSTQKTLRDSYANKQKREKKHSDHDLTRNFTIYNTNRNAGGVYFQEDINSRHNFDTQQEFSTFRLQRDLFYTIWNMWQTNHIDPSWSFSKALALKVRNIFFLSEDLINMIHLSKLFVSQLLTASRNATIPSEMDQLDIDVNKLMKLEKRFITPGDFSVEHQFPHNQNFFREFIIASHSVVFIEQLRIVLYTELLTLSAWDLEKIDDAGFEIIQIDDVDDDHPLFVSNRSNKKGGGERRYRFTRREVIADLMVLAKFFGFVNALPFSHMDPNHQQSLNIFNKLPIHMANYQLEARNRMRPNYDFYGMLCNSLNQDKLLVVIPWLIQFFAMLDDVTLLLDDNFKVLRMLFAIHINLGSERRRRPCVVSSRVGAFIIRLCIGWFITRSKTIVKEYYKYYAISFHYEIVGDDLSDEMKVIEEYLQRTGAAAANANSVQAQKFDSFLDSILVQVCPFMAEFRVSIISNRHYEQSKLSSSRKFRRITTYVLDIPSKNVEECTVDKITVLNDSNVDCNQRHLRAYFLNTQSTEMRQLIKYCTERCYKCLIKDCEAKILAPSKITIDKLCNEITSVDHAYVCEAIRKIYDDAHEKNRAEIDKYTANTLRERIRLALDALLPHTMTPILSRAYALIIEQDAMQMIRRWVEANVMVTSNIDFEELANRLLSTNSNKSKIDTLITMSTRNLKIKNLTISVADFMRDLQLTIHCASARPDLYSGPEAIISLLNKLPTIFEGNVLPCSFYHFIASNIVYLMQNIITHHPDDATAQLMQLACSIWMHPKVLAAMKALQIAATDAANLEPNSPIDYHTYKVYDALISISFFSSFGENRVCYQKISQLLIMMLRRKVISVEFAHRFIIQVLKYNWDLKPLSYISRMLCIVAKIMEDRSKKGSSGDGDGDADADADADDDDFDIVDIDFDSDADEEEDDKEQSSISSELERLLDLNFEI